MLLATEVLNLILLEGCGHWNYTLHKGFVCHFSQDQDQDHDSGLQDQDRDIRPQEQDVRVQDQDTKNAPRDSLETKICLETSRLCFTVGSAEYI